MSRPPAWVNVNTAVPATPSANSTSPGTMNSHFGQNSNRKRRCCYPSRKLRRCGPSGATVGLQRGGDFADPQVRQARLTIIPLANSIPPPWRPSSTTASLRNARIPQRKSCTGAPVQEPADPRQERVADPAVEPWHGAAARYRRQSGCRSRDRHRRGGAPGRARGARGRSCRRRRPSARRGSVRRGSRRSGRCRSPCGAPARRALRRARARSADPSVLLLSATMTSPDMPASRSQLPGLGDAAADRLGLVEARQDDRQLELGVRRRARCNVVSAGFSVVARFPTGRRS